MNPSRLFRPCLLILLSCAVASISMGAGGGGGCHKKSAQPPPEEDDDEPGEGPENGGPPEQRTPEAENPATQPAPPAPNEVFNPAIPPSDAPPTPRPRWGQAQLIESNDEADINAPQIAIDGSGNAIAAWAQENGGRVRFEANRFNNATDTWEGVATLADEETPFGLDPPAVALQSDGAGLVGRERAVPDFNVLIHRFRPATGWDVLPPPATGDNAAQARGVFLPNGDILVVWVQNTEAGFKILANRYLAATDAWEGERSIDVATPPGVRDLSASSFIAADPNGNATVVWLKREGDRFDVWSNRHNASTNSWLGAEPIEGNNDGNAWSPSVVMAENGDALAVWQQFDGTRRNIWANRFSATAGAWDLPVLLERNDASDAWLPQAAAVVGGDFMVVWSQGAAAGPIGVRVNRYLASANRWEGEGLLTAPDRFGVTPHVAGDGNGNAVVVWTQANDAALNIWARRFDGAIGWEPPVCIQAARTMTSIAPRVAYSANGTAVAVWGQEDESGRRSVWANVLKTR